MQNQQFHHFGYLVHGDGVMVIAAKVAWHLKIISLFYINFLTGNLPEEKEDNSFFIPTCGK